MSAHTAIPTWNVTLYPDGVVPVGITSSDARLSPRIPSEAFAIGFIPRDAWTPLMWTVALTASGNAICVTLTVASLILTSTWMWVARPAYQPG